MTGLVIDGRNEDQWWTGKGQILHERLKEIVTDHTPSTRRDILGMMAAELLPPEEAQRVVDAVPDDPPAGNSDAIWSETTSAAYNVLFDGAYLAVSDLTPKEEETEAAPSLS